MNNKFVRVKAIDEGYQVIFIAVSEFREYGRDIDESKNHYVFFQRHRLEVKKNGHVKMLD